MKAHHWEFVYAIINGNLMPANFFYYHNLLAIIVAHTGTKRYSHPLLTIGAREIQMEIHQLIQNLHINIWCSNSFGACLCNQLSTFHFTSSEPMKATTRARIAAQVKIVILTIANVIGGSNAILVILYRTLKP